MDSPIDVREITAKSILSPSHLKEADYDYSLNPYTGCRFGCVYCYASFMSRYAGKQVDDWGTFVFAKMNAPDLLRTEIRKLKNHGKDKVIWFSSVTDPYQGMEMKYRLTRKCLEVLVEEGFQGAVSFLTKSDLVLQDIDILQKLPHVEVGLTITSTDDKVSRYFEKYAPAASARLSALGKLHEAKIPIYAFVGPLLPHFVDEPEKIDALFQSIRDVGVEEVYVEYLNLSTYIRNRMRHELSDLDPALWKKFYETQNKQYRVELDKIVDVMLKKHHLKIRMGGTLYHKEMS